MGTERLAVWHDLPSGGAKRFLAAQVRLLSAETSIDLYTTSLVDDRLFPIEPYCSSVTRYELLPSAGRRLQRIRRRWIQADRAYQCARQAAADIDARAYAKVFVHLCQIEHSPSVLRFLRTTPSVFFCQEPLREVYEPALPSLRPKPLVGRLLRAPELQRRRRRDHLALHSAGTVLVNSEYSRQQIRRWYQRDCTVCYPGVDVEFFIPSVEPREPYLLSVGRLDRLKGHDLVIAIAGAMETRRPVIIVADATPAEEAERLHRLARATRVPLSIRSRIGDQDLLTLYQRAQAVVCAQRLEPFGLVPLEAMAAGAPVFAVPEGGFVETVREEQTGYFIPRDPRQARARLETVLGDADRLGQVTARARETVVRDWSWTVHLERLKVHLAH